MEFLINIIKIKRQCHELKYCTSINIYIYINKINSTNQNKQKERFFILIAKGKKKKVFFYLGWIQNPPKPNIIRNLGWTQFRLIYIFQVKQIPCGGRLLDFFSSPSPSSSQTKAAVRRSNLRPSLSAYIIDQTESTLASQTA